MGVANLMSPLQLAVYWRLALVFFFTSFLFFLDIFAAAIVANTCQHHGNNTTTGNGTSLLSGTNQSQAREDSEGGNLDCVLGQTGWPTVRLSTRRVSCWGLWSEEQYQTGTVSARCCWCVCVSTQCVAWCRLSSLRRFYSSLCAVSPASAAAASTSAHSVWRWSGPPSARLWPPAFLPFCFSVGTMCGAPLVYFSTTWRLLHLSLALPQIVCLPLYLAIPESPSWLLLRGRTDVLDRYRSNSPADKQCLDLLLESAWSDLQKSTEAQEPIGGRAFSDIINLKHPKVLLRLVIMSYLSAVSAMTYYGICMNIGSFGVDVYSAQFFSGLSESPCLLVPLVRLGRRPISMLALFLSGAACFLSLLLSRYHGEPVLVMSLALLGKLCILAAIFISILYSIELFPTVVRQRCISLVNLSFRLGCLTNSLVPPSSNGAISLAAMAVYSCGPIVGCGLCLLLPETSGVPLPESVEDCDRQPDMRKIWRTGKLVSSLSRKTEIPPAVKDDTHTPNTQTGLL